MPLLPEIKKVDKVMELVANLGDKKEHIVHARNLKQALNHGLVLKKVHKIIKFIQKTWLKSYINMNTELRKKANMISKKNFSK